ncbi:anti sigma factor C-terminal domain-containing protein [Xylocopilactobacillus apis]|uniref:Anti-sigma factor n=1 Tax=Xylocopilactobacillus apis TaxID=2932183 RepID=A0AAU9DJC5_9LACO|nr:anti sigma factor C-terminal domain-containing protein [Xylocopilactobacillus apis]BDR55504.1 hypothetical protein KIMC2_00660 [Xylocopilactobacillus apis]
MNEEQKFERLARKVKVKRWLAMIGLSIVTALAVLLITYQVMKGLVRNQSSHLFEEMSIQSQIMSPNIEISDQLLADDTNLKGKIVSHRYKKIDGYRVPWSNFEGRYGLFRRRILDDSTTDSDSMNGEQVFDRVTQNKIPTFYNRKYVKSSNSFTQTKVNEISKLNQMKGYVAELAITFKKPMTYDEIKKLFPKNLRTEWYWIGMSGTGAGSNQSDQYIGFQADNGVLKSDYYKWFCKYLLEAPASLLGKHSNFNGSKFAKDYAKKYPKLSDAKFEGVIITGKSENFKQIENADWIENSSIGVTIKTVPYIKPEY